MERLADGPVSRILRLGSDAPSRQSTYGKQRTYSVSDVNCVSRARITGTRRTHLLIGLSLLAALLLAGVALAQEQPGTYRVPFHDADGLIVLDAKVNGKEAHLVMDTGAAHTHVDRESIGSTADYTATFINLRVSGYELRNFPVLAHDLAPLLKSVPGATGILGQDWLRHFQSIRIDYKSHVVELESSR